MRWIHSTLEERFGTMKQMLPPLVFCGISHEYLGDGHLFCHQLQYLQKLKPIVLEKHRLKQEQSSLKPKEHFDFRSNVCSLLWLTLTRQDIIADVVLLQQHMVTPIIKDAITANITLKRTLSNAPMSGFHFHRLAFPLKVCAVNDSSHVSGASLYAQ